MWSNVLVFVLFAWQVTGAPDGKEQNPFPRRQWEVQERYYVGDKSFYKRAIFPSIRQCVKTEDILLVQLDIANEAKDPYAGPDLKTWSGFLNNFIFFNPHIMENDPEYKKVMDNMEGDIRYLAARFGIAILMAAMFLFTLFGCIALPIVGLIVFRTLHFIWRGLTSAPIRRFGRYIVIQAELTRRKRNRYLIPILINKNVPRRFYRVPRCFREYSDEDEPEILRNFQGTIAIQIKDSDSEVSLNQLYREYYRNGEPIVRTDPKTGIPLTREQLKRTVERSKVSLGGPVPAAGRETEIEQQKLDILTSDEKKGPEQEEEEDPDTDYDADDDDDDESDHQIT